MLRRKLPQFMTEEVTFQKRLFPILTSVNFPDLKQIMLQSLAYLLRDLLERNL
jgi:hypothetical protein